MAQQTVLIEDKDRCLANEKNKNVELCTELCSLRQRCQELDTGLRQAQSESAHVTQQLSNETQKLASLQ